MEASYAGEKKQQIIDRGDEVKKAWEDLLKSVDYRRESLVDTHDKFCFFNMVRDLLAWMATVMRQIDSQEKPKYVTSVHVQYRI